MGLPLGLWDLPPFISSREPRMSLPIYLDYNATTPVLPTVFEAMAPWLQNNFGNAGCSHIFGQKANQAIADARQAVAELIGAQDHEITFTSGGTESNNLATIGVMSRLSRDAPLIISSIEHPAIHQPAHYLKRLGHPLTELPVDATGCIDPASLIGAVGDAPGLLSVMHSNNEVGTIQPIAALAAEAHRNGFLVHSDASQSVGKVPIHVDHLGVDLLTIAGHKLYAPKGIGALYIRSGTPIGPVLHGASQERGLSPGTQPVASIVGLGAACRLAAAELQVRMQTLTELRDLLYTRLHQAIPTIRLHGHPTARLPNTLNVGFPGVTGTHLLAACPSIAASTGSACHAHGEEPSNVLRRMGIGRTEALEAVRLTLGNSTTRPDILRAAHDLVNAWRSLT